MRITLRRRIPKIKTMTVNKIVWRNRLLAIKRYRHNDEFKEAYPVTKDHGSEFLTKKEEAAWLEAELVDKEGKWGTKNKSYTMEELVELSLRRRFAQQKKNPDWVEEFVSGEEITESKNLYTRDPRLEGVHTGQELETPEPTGQSAPKFELKNTSFDDLNELTIDQLITIAAKTDVIGWGTRDKKPVLLEKICKHHDIEMPK